MKRLIILLIAIFFITNANSQDNAREANHHFKIENYPVALRLFTALYNKDTTYNADNYNLGVCHLNTNSNPEKALFFLKKEFGKLKDDQLYLFELGKAYSFNYNFDKAKEYYSMAINKNPKNTEFVELCQLHIKMADNAILYTKSPLNRYIIHKFRKRRKLRNGRNYTNYKCRWYYIVFYNKFKIRYKNIVLYQRCVGIVS